MPAEKLPELPYFYGAEAETFSFYRIPKALFTEPAFAGLSTDAKLLYGLMLDRMQLSAKNGWLDGQGRVFIYYSLENIMQDLGCANQKATRLLAELDEKYRLIERKRQGQGKPAMIFVKDFTAAFTRAGIQNHENHDSKLMKIMNPDSWKSHTNNTEIKDTEYSNTESIYHASGAVGGVASSQERCDGMDEYENIREYFLEKLDFGCLLVDYPDDRDALFEILGLLVDTVCSRKRTIRISGEEKPAGVVKSQLMKLDGEHIRYVMGCMKENTTKVRNIRQYLLTALYNAPMTIGSYYSSRVSHDLYGDG